MPYNNSSNSLFHTPLVGHAVVDADGCISRVNHAFTRFTRYSAQQLEGAQLQALLHPDDSLPVRGATARLRYLSSDGQLCWGDTCTLSVEAADNSSDNFILQVRDQTSDHMEQQVQKGRARVLELLYNDDSLPEICETIVRFIETLGEGMRCSILTLDAERGTLHKAAAPSLPDFYSEAIEGMHIGEGVGSCGTAAFRRERVVIADILNHPYWERARRLVSRTPMRACWSEPIIAGDGSLLGSFAIYYDTPREPQPDELDLIASAASLTAIAITYKRSQQVLHDLNRAKDEFISIAAHELRTPLSAIMGYSELFAEEGTDLHSQQMFAREISANGESMSRLIDDLLDLSLIQVGRRLNMVKQKTLLMPLLEKVIGYFSRSAPLHDLKLCSGQDLPEEISCDAGRIIQVLENILSNAIKYSPDGGPVTLEVERSADSVSFCVTDQGIGMSETEVRRVFDKFFRADASNTAPGGLGIGLCIVRDIVEGHGGEIYLKSRQKEGTRVTFSLPI
ncbi:MAG: GAF domain-containing protein [Geobacteraceae bacterium]|nr:GAF domain-containing protein [Geobacteraceae bacterium]